MDQEELEQLIAEDKVKVYPNGDYRYTAKSDRQAGALAKRPANAAEPFNSETGLISRQAQLENDRLAHKMAFIETVAERHELNSDELSFEEARKIQAGEVYTKVFEEDKLRDRIAGERYIDETLGLKEPKAPLVDMSQKELIVMDSGQKRVIVDAMNRSPQMFVKMGQLSPEQAQQIEAGNMVITLDDEEEINGQ